MSETKTDETTAKQVGPTEGGLINVRLAHPLNDKDRAYLGLDDDQTLNVGDVLTLAPSSAQALIGSGMANVNPNDPAAVAEAMGISDPTLVPSTGVSSPAVADGPVAEPGRTEAPVLLGADAIAALKGQDLDAALGERGLSTSGTADEKRQRLSEFVPTA